MAADDQLIISHEDGRRYGVTRAGFEELYKDQGFTIEGPETEDAFTVKGVPAPKARRSSPRAKGTARPKPKAARPLAAAPAPSEPESVAE